MWFVFRFTFLVVVLGLLPPLQAQDCSELEARLKTGNLLDIDQLITANKYTCNATIGQIYLRLGRNDLAEEYFKKSLATAPNQSEAQAEAYNSLGIVNWNLGNNEIASQMITQGLEIRKKLYGNNHELVAASYNDLGLVTSSYNIDQALDYYENAYTIYKGVFGEHHEKSIQSLINAGIAYRGLTFYGDATVNFDKALLGWQKLYPQGHPNEAFILTNIGLTKQLTNDLTGAKNYFEKALVKYLAFYGNKHPEVANTYNLIGSIYNRQGEFDLALSYYQKAILANSKQFKNEDLEFNPTADDYINANILLSSLYYKSKAFSDLHFNKTLKFNDLKLSLATLQVCDTLIDNIRQLRTNESDKIALGSIAATIYETGVELSKAMGDVAVKKDEYYQNSFYFAEKSKSAVLLEAISDAKAKAFVGLEPAELEKEQILKTSMAFYENQLNTDPPKEEITRYNTALLDLKNQYTAFVKNLESKYPEYYNLKYNSSIPSIAELQGQLSDNQVILSYYLTDLSKRVYIYEITKSKFRIYNNPQTENFERYLNGFKNSIYYKDKDIYLLTATELHTTLIPKKLDKNITDLIIIPSGRLGTIPFEALLTAKVKSTDGYEMMPFLIKNYNISYYYASALIKPKNETIDMHKNAFLCAPVNFASLDNLPGTQKEVNQLASILDRQGFVSKIKLNEEATELTVKNQNFDGYKYIHLATHGVVDEQNPANSKIYLNQGQQEDGNLFSGEIYNLKLNADLITLSACETGLGKLSKGEGVIGLSRALLYAGASNLVVSLWKVSDDSTSDLMIEFYNSLAQKGYSQSLSAAKVKLINDQDYAQPYYWAPFILIGQ